MQTSFVKKKNNNNLPNRTGFIMVLPKNEQTNSFRDDSSGGSKNAKFKKTYDDNVGDLYAMSRSWV